jgi:hypothetical protein
MLLSCTMKPTAGTAATARIAIFVAALVLVLQSALAFAAPPVQRDIFGNMICADGSGGQMPGGREDSAKHLTDCCLLSCSAAFQASAGLPPETLWPASRREAGVSLPLPVAAVLALHDRRTPANPRAPPTAA